MKMCPYSHFWWHGYFWGPWVSFVTTDEFLVRVTKFTSKNSVSWNQSLPFFFDLFLTQWIMVLLSKGCKPTNFNNTLWNLALQIFQASSRILLIVNFSLNQTLLTFLLYVRQTYMTQLILVISLWGVIFILSRRILLLICIVLQCIFYMKEGLYLHGTYL